jgi:hypothetical protein
MIAHVAIKDCNGKVWSLPKPSRHAHVCWLLYYLHNKATADALLGEHIQGFVNDRGVFLNRLEAWAEAHRCNQVLPPYNPVNPSQRRGSVDETPRELFSEDLW